MYIYELFLLIFIFIFSLFLDSENILGLKRNSMPSPSNGRPNALFIAKPNFSSVNYVGKLSNLLL